MGEKSAIDYLIEFTLVLRKSSDLQQNPLSIGLGDGFSRQLEVVGHEGQGALGDLVIVCNEA